MLIRHAQLPGYPGLTDLRIMHGRVQEIGNGLSKGLYESELDLGGDELHPVAEDTPLSGRWRRVRPVNGAKHVTCGTPAPLCRWHGGVLVALIDEHAAD